MSAGSWSDGREAGFPIAGLEGEGMRLRSLHVVHGCVVGLALVAGGCETMDRIMEASTQPSAGRTNALADLDTPAATTGDIDGAASQYNGKKYLDAANCEIQLWTAVLPPGVDRATAGERSLVPGKPVARTVSDRKGNFRFNGVPSGFYILRSPLDSGRRGYTVVHVRMGVLVTSYQF